MLTDLVIPRGGYFFDFSFFGIRQCSYTTFIYHCCTKKFKIFRSGFNASVANYVKMEESTYQCNEYINLNQLKNGPEPANQAADGNFDCRHRTNVI